MLLGVFILGTGVLGALNPLAPAALPLTLQDSVHQQPVEQITLVPQKVLALPESVQNQAADLVDLVRYYQLSLPNSTHSHFVGSVGLTQYSELALANGLHLQAVGRVTLTEYYSLALADSLLRHTAEQPDAIYGPVLVLSDSLHNQFSGLGLKATETPCGRVFFVASESRIYVVASESRSYQVAPDCPPS